MNVGVNRQRGQEETREPAHGEQANKAQGVKHGRLVGDGTLVKRRRPVEDLDRGRDGHEQS